MDRINNFSFAVLTVLLIAAVCFALEDQGFLRYPDVYKDKVAFASEGDLWIAPLDGGIARRLTIHDGEERYPKFSPDGKWIAFSALYDGNQDVYIIPSEGGEPRRLTFHPGGNGVVGWTKDGKVMYRTSSFTGLRMSQIYTVTIDGDYPEQLPLPKAALASFADDGDRIAYTPIFRNNATWKHYKGGLADHIWVADLKKKNYGEKPISTFTGHNSYPMWIGERIYFLSDSIGRKNIWSMKPDGSDQKKITNHKDYDARWPSEGGNIIVYQLAMDIWKLDLNTGKTSKIDIQLPSERLLTRTNIMNPADYIGGFDLNKDGKWMVIEARGQLFTVPTKSRETVIRRLTGDFKSRAKAPFYLGDKVAALTDASGEDEFHQYDPFLKEASKQLTKGNKMWRYHGEPSPDGKKIAYSDGNLTLYILDVESGNSNKIFTSDVWEIRNYVWSPDSRYLAFVNDENENIQAIHIYDTQKNEDHIVTNTMYNSYHPAWDANGKYLYFLAEAYMNPLASRYFDQFVFLTPDKIYMYLLAEDVESPFAPEKELLGVKEDEDKKDDDKKKDEDEDEDKEKEEKSVEVKIDWAGLQDRMIELPIDAGYYHTFRAGEEMLYYISGSQEGWSPDGDRPERELHLFKIKDRKDHTVSTGVDAYDMSDDGKVVVIKKGSSFIRMDAGSTDEPKGEGDDDPHVKLDGWSMKHYPQQEWGQMFREAWRIQRDFFYDPNMHGVDWDAVLKLYEPLVSRISTRADLNDLIGEMIGELNAGHAYIAGGDLHEPKQISVGQLGADISRDSRTGYFRIDRIIAPDLVRSDWRSPLAQPYVKAKNGDYIIAIDGVQTNTVKNYLELLQDKADKDIILTLNSKPQVDGSRDVIVKTMGNENELRYRDWVESRRKYTEEKSGGKLGYVHMSDMSVSGMQQFGQMYYPQYKKQGMILDVRFNGGGSIATLLLSQLDRKIWSTDMSRHGGTGWRPYSAFNGHFAVLCNNETGSDGETFTEGAKMLGLGKVFGTRTWGGWVGIRSDKPLNDDAWYTTPEFTGWGAFGDKAGKWLIEGPGVYPDVEIENDPGSMMKGEDSQLDAGIEYLLRKIKDEPKTLPPQPAFPIKETNLPKKK